MLPNGFAERSVVLGGGCPSALVPASAGHSASEAELDLVVLAPSAAESDDPHWIGGAVQEVVSRLSQTGVAYVLPVAGARRLRRALAASGLGARNVLLHVPDVARSRHVVPVGTAAERYALSGQLPMSSRKRLIAGLALRVPRLAVLAPSGTVHSRSTPVLARWLFELEGAVRPPGSVLVSLNGTVDGAVLHRFGPDDSEPDAVAKISPRADAEARALQEVAPDAARAGARVPTMLVSGTLASMPFMLQSAVRGQTAALLIERRRRMPRGLQEQIAGWLERWSLSTASAGRLGREELERRIREPAGELARDLLGNGSLYRDYLDALCARAEGALCPFVSSHGDLTLANVLLDGGGIGVVDWEEASANSLPLFDFFYSAADALAAEGSYIDRVGAFRSCFGPEGAHAAFIAGLRRRLAAAVGVPAIVQEVSFHACWLHHAANEHTRGTAPGPFGQILRAIAARPELYRLTPA